MSHPNETLIKHFYDALGKCDSAAMAACYADQARFSDPVFGDLDAAAARAMWAMLCARASDLDIVVSDIEANDRRGRARWVARYTFAKTGRKVHNVIDASFEFADGRIVTNMDCFDLWRWAAMALGIKGRLLGWLPSVQNAIRREAAKGLQAYRRRNVTGHTMS